MKLTGSHPWETATARRVQRVVFVYWFVADHELTARPGSGCAGWRCDLLLTGNAALGLRGLRRLLWPGQEDATFNRMKEVIAAAVPQFQFAAGAPAVLARNP